MQAKTMKVLIADDDQPSRKLLDVVLRKGGYEGVVAVDGPEALQCAETLTEPYIAILDWMMPGMSGLQVCAALRSAKTKIRPYVIMLSSKSDKGDIAAALDVGADDYLSKPFDNAELLARLRVAARTLQYQQDLHLQIGQLEAMVHRYNLLGEIVAQQGGKRGRAGAEQDAGDDRAAHQLSAGEADDIVQRVLGELRLGEVEVASPLLRETYLPAEYTAWAGLILEQEQVWLDLLLEVDAAAMTTIFEASLGRRPAADREKQEFLAETHTIISSAFKMDLQRKGYGNFAPILTRVMHTQGSKMPVPAKRDMHRYTVAGVAIGLTLVWRECRRQMLSPNWLRVSDIMAEAYPPREVNENPLLSKGTVLTERFIEKLVTLSEGEPKKLEVPVFSASPLAVFFVGDGR